MWKSARFRVGAIFASPIPPTKGGPSLSPQSSTLGRLRTALRPSLSASRAKRHIGLTRFRAASTDCEGSASSPVIVCQHIRTKQADIRSRAILAGARYDKSRLAPQRLTTFNRGSLTLTLRSSLALRSNAISEVMPIPSRGRRTPLGWLPCPRAWHPAVAAHRRYATGG